MQAQCRTHPRFTRGCPECQERARDYARARRAGLADGTWASGLVSDEELERVHAHITRLVGIGGVTTMRVVEVAGVSHHALDALRVNRTVRMSRWVAESLLGVTARACLALIDRDTIPVDSAGTRRRLQALAVDGWSTERIATLSGVPVSVVRQHRSGGNRRAEITWGHHERFRLFYEKVQTQMDPDGGSRAVRAAAATAGWLGPERWADDEIDDPYAEPLPPPPDTEDWVEVTQMIEGVLCDPRPGKAANYPRDVQREIARQATQRLGWSYERVGELFGRTASTVEYLLIGRKDRPHTRGAR